MLKDKVAIVTGSGRGIGSAIALKLAEHGAHIVISDVSEEALQESVEKVRMLNRRCQGIVCNVTDFESCQNLAETALEKFRQIDILVNNAGVTRDNLLLRMSPEDFDFVIDVNLRGVFHCCKAIIPKMPRRGPGSVINISSVIGIMGNAGQTNYAASKAGVLGITRSLAKEYAKRGIRVNAIAPGYIQTAMTDKLDEKVREEILKFIPMSRMGQPEDVANIALFLASDLSSYVTGQVIPVDGGMVMA